MSFCEISVDLIDYSEFMVREIDGQTINDLKESIKKHSVLQPILVFRNEKTDRFQVICGNHRLCAAKGLGLKTIPAIIKVLNSSDDAVFLSLTENVQRFEMNPIREGEIYSHLLEKDRYPIEMLVERLGKSKFYINSRISIFKNLHEDLKVALGKTLTLTNATSLSRLPKTEQLEIFNQIRKLANTKPENPNKSPWGLSESSPYCICDKCGAKHLKGVSIEK